MANSLLTPKEITRKALVILHQKLNFVGNVNRTYDSKFAKEGAKIGNSIDIRLPNQYVVTDGPNLVTQDTNDQVVTLQINKQKHVGVSFSSVERTLSLDDYADRVLEPAMAQLAASIEADAFSMMLDVPYAVNNIGSPLTFRKVLEARKILNDNLAPMDNNRSVILNTTDNVDMVDQLKGLFQDSTQIAKQYREGMMGRTGGFDFWENTLMPGQVTGTAAAATGYTVNGAAQTGATIVVATGTATFKKGDVITIGGVNRVHPESKVDTGTLQQFVVTADFAGGAGTINISPSIVATGAYQNVTASPANGAAIAKLGTASGIYRPSLAFHRDAFAFATVDLILPPKKDAYREVYDGISMRFVSDYNIQNDTLPARFDVLYGYKTIRPQLAVRLLSN
ncbi:hypothetical protein AVMA1855_20045 [Acidovorax sp. SUPP1855]|uniref:P22 phage major capsid protein family protein n=1 Tax=Acidovorax sp. SUPP1855 TaxID=431774 RepID=UPI0023DE458A|nr:P22 phage major capsid protein family protein [Acidovorax sp. SUPP1855]GKS86483.1 hypothetical protein AVMA1855_20045 [Acidovorax sp. SUPP1855]